jgi:flagellar basal body-associated protein FliL
MTPISEMYAFPFGRMRSPKTESESCIKILVITTLFIAMLGMMFAPTLFMESQ